MGLGVRGPAAAPVDRLQVEDAEQRIVAPGRQVEVVAEPPARRTIVISEDELPDPVYIDEEKEREFYERSTDPFEICNAHSLMPPQEAHLLSAWLARLRGSCGAAFRANETWQTWIPWVTSRAAG